LREGHRAVLTSPPHRLGAAPSAPPRRGNSNPSTRRVRFDGAAPESNRPSRGLHDRTGFEDLLGHRARAAPRPPYRRATGASTPSRSRRCRRRQAARRRSRSRRSRRRSRSGACDPLRFPAGSCAGRAMTWILLRFLPPLGDTGRQKVRMRTATRPQHGGCQESAEMRRAQASAVLIRSIAAASASSPPFAALLTVSASWRTKPR